MLYICIPTYNEAPTIGVLLWRIRKVLKDFPREYEIVVFDDGSNATPRTHFTLPTPFGVSHVRPWSRVTRTYLPPVKETMT